MAVPGSTFNHIHFSICPALDGVNILVPHPVENGDEFFLRDSPSQAVRGVRGSFSGTYDTLQPSQDETRDPEITASPAACP